jgi:phosphoenolpyruvate-protein phosphotransferase (PTS system enzyme I)
MKNTSPIILRGLPVSKGISIGIAHVIEHGNNVIEEKYIEKKLVPKEIKRLKTTFKKTLTELDIIKSKISPSIKKNIGLFLDTHILLISDKTFLESIETRIKENFNSSEWAIHTEYLNIKESFENIEDLYIKQRIDDVNHVVKMLLNNLIIKKDKTNIISKSFNNVIVVTDDLSPADVIITHESKGLGLISEYGGRSSHSSILTRSLELPSIVGVKNALKIIRNDDYLILDGNEGLIFINPEKDLIKHYQDLKKSSLKKKRVLSTVLAKKNISLDKERLEIMANLELPQELKIISEKNIDGIGLFRTEYLYADRDDFPTENEQFLAYKQIVKKMKNNPVIFRTLDIGADKEIPDNVKTGSIAHNPALGLRGIRYSLGNQTVFINQVKAMLRAGYYGTVKIMLPMITNFSEISDAKKLIATAKKNLKRERKKFSNNVKVGIMVEVPSCAVLADRFAQQVDFFSIGTNDLVQYTLAIDRVDDEVNYLYDPVNSAVLNLIKIVIDAGAKNKIPVSLCGEMAGDSNYTRLLLGLGLKSFSMHPSAIPEIKNVMISSDIKKLKRLSREIINCNCPIEKNKLLAKINNI